MQVTIYKDAAHTVVAVNGESYALPPSSAPHSATLPPTFHALQWDGARGELEHRMAVCDHCGVRSKKANEEVTDFAPYQSFVDAWRVVKTAADIARAKAVAEAAALEKAGTNATTG